MENDDYYYEYLDYGQTLAPPGRFSSVSTGFSHSCALRDTGEVVCWGATSPGARAPPDLQ